MTLFHTLAMLLAIILLAAVLLIGHARNQDERPPTVVVHALRQFGARAWAFLVRWQEHSGWLPLMLVLGLLAYIAFGALDRTAIVDALALWVQLPPRAGYAIAALGLTHLARKRWRQRFSDTEQSDLRRRLLAGERGALLVLGADLAFTVIVMVALLFHFRMPA